MIHGATGIALDLCGWTPLAGLPKATEQKVTLAAYMAANQCL